MRNVICRMAVLGAALAMFLMLIAGCGGSGGGDSTPTVVAPVASFSVEIVGAKVKFTDTSTGGPTGWTWDFGDQTQPGTLQNVEHVYANSGTYTAKLTARNDGGSNSISKAVTVVVTTPIVRPTLQPMPEADLVGKANVLINQAHATFFPELADRVAVKAMFDNINTVLDKYPGNKKRCVLDELIIYPDADFNSNVDNITGNPAYIKNNNNFVGNPSYGGTSLVLWYSVDEPRLLPKFFVDSGGGEAYHRTQYIAGKKYSVSYLAGKSQEDYLLVRRNSTAGFANGFSFHDYKMRAVLHEMVGHGGGGVGGAPEYYSLNFQDNSPTLPNLGLYDFNGKFVGEPMSGFVGDIQENKFSPYVSWMIMNNNYQFDAQQIADAIKTMSIKVKVVDIAGNLIDGALVTSRGGVARVGGSGVGVAKNMETLLETLAVTDVNGFTNLTNDFNVDWFAKGIKASFGSKVGGAVLTSVDLQMAYWMQNQDEYVLTIIIQEPTLSASSAPNRRSLKDHILFP